MKLLPSFKSAKALVLAAATIATAIAAGNVTSTLAQTTPTPDLNSKHGETRPGSISFSNSGPNLITKFYVKYTVAGKSFTFESENLLAPGKVRFSISPKATNIVAIGKYFTGLQKPILFEKPIKPGSNVCFKIFRNGPLPSSPVAFDNSCTDIPVTPPTPPFTPPTPPAPPAPPVTPPPNAQQMTVTVINRGAYVARYRMFYRVGVPASSNQLSGNITVGNRFTFFIPPNATEVFVNGVALTGVFEETKTIFQKIGLPNTHNNICFTTTGTTFSPSFNNSCN